MQRIVLISDTHSAHREVQVPEADFLIFAGDMSVHGSRRECRRFMAWMAEQPCPYKICIAGNHDFYFEEASPEQLKADIPSDVLYLNDGMAEVGGLKIWGSPVQPTFLQMAFNRDRGEAIRRHWALIPEGLDVLVTHGPAFGILDRTDRGMSVGCQDLRQRIAEVRPRLHVCGHIHEARGHLWHQGTLFVNASSSARYGRDPKHPPMQVAIDDQHLSVLPAGIAQEASR
jgi:predicted phosphodiesterase